MTAVPDEFHPRLMANPFTFTIEQLREVLIGGACWYAIDNEAAGTARGGGSTGVSDLGGRSRTIISQDAYARHQGNRARDVDSNCLDCQARRGAPAYSEATHATTNGPQIPASQFCVPSLRCGLNGPRNCSGLFRM